MGAIKFLTLFNFPLCDLALFLLYQSFLLTLLCVGIIFTNRRYWISPSSRTAINLHLSLLGTTLTQHSSSHSLIGQLPLMFRNHPLLFSSSDTYPSLHFYLHPSSLTTPNHTHSRAPPPQRSPLSIHPNLTYTHISTSVPYPHHTTASHHTAPNQH